MLDERIDAADVAAVPALVAMTGSGGLVALHPRAFGGPRRLMM